MANDAMTSRRPYREKVKKVEAMEELIKNSGIQFDPRKIGVALCCPVFFRNKFYFFII